MPTAPPVMARSTRSDEPLPLPAGDLNYPQTATTGQVMAAQKIYDSGVNLGDKESLSRSWDIHAERQLKCTDCHHALNNPAHADESAKAEPAHLRYDPRALDITEYLQKPDHNFARGQSAQFNVAPELKGTMRRCDNCHDATGTRRLAALCRQAHGRPRLRNLSHPADVRAGDPVLRLDRAQRRRRCRQVCRGVDGDPDKVPSLVTGYEPVLLNRTNVDGQHCWRPTT